MKLTPRNSRHWPPNCGAKGQQMKFYDAAIAATALARGDQLLTLDGDFDRLSDKLQLLKF
jgi:predicted nucleic acid-binding protein